MLRYMSVLLHMFKKSFCLSVLKMLAQAAFDTGGGTVKLGLVFDVQVLACHDQSSPWSARNTVTSLGFRSAYRLSTD